MLKIRRIVWKVLVAFVLVLPISLAAGKVATADVQGGWRGEYFNNMTLSGSPALVRVDKAIDFNWGVGSPEWGVISADNFSVRWTGTINVSAGRYRFVMATDDGGRLWVNGQLVIDKWQEQQSQHHEVTIDLPGGSAYVQMEYYENQGGATALLAYMRTGGNSGGGNPVSNPAPGPWRAEYFNNTALSGSPVLARDEGQPNSYWGYGSPAPGVVGNDFFSARWSRNLDITPGRYRFTATTDDGVRLWVNNQLIINNWRNQAAQPSFGEIDLAGGIVPIRMEYYEADVTAEARLSWTRIGSAPNTGGAPMAIVSSYSLNVRQGPGMTYAIISQLSRGQLIQLAGTRNADASWVKVILPDGRQGWSYAGYMQSSIPFASLAVEGGQQPPAGPAGGSTASVARAYHVNVRSGPGAGYSVLTVVPAGTVVQPLGRNAAASWANIRLANGTVGWMNAYYLNSATPINSLAIVG